jgi:hypothetical protein
LLLLLKPAPRGPVAAGVFGCSLLASFACWALELLLLPSGGAHVSLLCEGGASGAAAALHNTRAIVLAARDVCCKVVIVLQLACITKGLI